MNAQRGPLVPASEQAGRQSQTDGDTTAIDAAIGNPGR